jgi:hypothetical protein
MKGQCSKSDYFTHSASNKHCSCCSTFDASKGSDNSGWTTYKYLPSFKADKNGYCDENNKDEGHKAKTAQECANKM